ncbi:MAG: ATP-dependent sacrificial sulfur transferase LarE [Candidatus Nanopelagicales bacterium]
MTTARQGPAPAPLTVPLVVGFDLDMTLVDSADGIVAAIRHVLAAHGVEASDAEVRATVGLPLDLVFPRWLSDLDYASLLAEYRAHYARYGIPATVPLPGAAQALSAVRALGGRTVVVTAKKAEHAWEACRVAGLAPDEVVGELFAEAKGAVLRERGAFAYVGDHAGDVRAAAVAGALAVVVPTGPTSADVLAEAGADVVLPDLDGFPAWLSGAVLDHRLADLERRLRALGSVLVAFSGGADSALLLAAAVRALGADRVAAATAISDSLPAGELAGARAFAAGLGVRLVTPVTHELDREGYRANAGDRCYFCKAELLEVLTPLAGELGLAAVATGTNADDVVAGFRPGIRAAAERGAATPLADAGLSKAQVRTASRVWGLPTWDKPQAACLSSRIAYGLQVTPSRLRRVDVAERAVRAALAAEGIVSPDVRVRDLGEAARVEVTPSAVAAAAASPAVAEAVRSAGFGAVEVDPRGFRSGAMNELLDEPDRYR